MRRSPVETSHIVLLLFLLLPQFYLARTMALKAQGMREAQKWRNYRHFQAQFQGAINPIQFMVCVCVCVLICSFFKL